MNPYVKMAVALAMIAIGAFGAWYTTSDHYQKQIAEIQLAQQKVVADELAQHLAEKAAHEKATQLAGEQHAKDQLRINNLVSQLNGVRIRFPSGGAMPQAGTGANPDGACRLAAARADEYMAEAQRAINDIGARCAQLNADAIQANAVNR